VVLFIGGTSGLIYNVKGGKVVSAATITATITAVQGTTTALTLMVPVATNLTVHLVIPEATNARMRLQGRFYRLI
jgi:hypothetical protein